MNRRMIGGIKAARRNIRTLQRPRRAHSESVRFRSFPSAPSVHRYFSGVAILVLGVLFSGCGRPETRVSVGDREQILHLGNGAEPQDLDPQIVTGTIEDNIIRGALFEGLVSEDPHDLHPVPGVAESWEISPDATVYTFHLRANARWSNGERVTASDFVKSYQRMLSPTLAAEYAYMLFLLKNGEEYYSKKTTDFNDVGVKALNDSTLQITLANPTAYFLSMLNHYSYFPVPISTIAKFGPLDSRNNRWTRPENMVCNGAFILKKWRLNDVIVVTRNTNYWDAEKVRLREVRFYPIESQDTEERAFRSGQLHVTYDMPLPKIPAYQENAAALLRIDPYLGTYFYRVNVTKPELKDVRVRRALAMAIDRDALVRDVTRGGEVPAHSFVPPGAAGFHGSAAVPSDIPAAKKLFAEAGYPDGKGFPKLEIHYNTLEKHKIIAEAIQEMWRKNLGIDVHLINQEWKVYTDTQRRLDYQIGRYGWIGDYVDPNSFMDLMVTGGGNNQTGYSNPEYDRLVHEAACTIDQKRRYVYFDEAEKILMNDLPVLPIFFYTKPFLIRPSVHGWNPTILDHHPLKYVYLEPDVAQTARR